MFSIDVVAILGYFFIVQVFYGPVCCQFWSFPLTFTLTFYLKVRTIFQITLFLIFYVHFSIYFLNLMKYETFLIVNYKLFEDFF